MVGVFIAPLFPFDDKILFITFLTLFFIAFLFRKDKVVLVTAFTAIFLVLGFWRFFYALPESSENFISFYNGKEAEIQGYIESYPQEKDKNETFTVEVSKVKIKDNWKDTRGKIYISISKLKDFEYGENIYLKGKLEGIADKDEEQNLINYYIARRTYSKMSFPEARKESGNSGNFIFKFLFKIKKAFEEKNDQVFIEPFASLVLGIILGVKRVSRELLDNFNTVSISHIIVISGYNLSVIVDFLKKVFQNFSRRISFWLPLLGITSFTFLVGAEAPVVRATIMAGVLLFAKKKGRKANGVFMLLFAAFIMVILNPFLLMYDVGFQLSFLATLGLILISEKILGLVKKIKIPFVLSEALASTVAAQIFILPLMIYYFGRLSLVAPLANVLVLPVVPFIMFSSFAVIVLGFLSLEFARFLSVIPGQSISYIINVANYFSRFSWASVSLEKTFIFIPLYYSGLSIPYFVKLIKRFRSEKSS